MSTAIVVLCFALFASLCASQQYGSNSYQQPSYNSYQQPSYNSYQQPSYGSYNSYSAPPTCASVVCNSGYPVTVTFGPNSGIQSYDENQTEFLQAAPLYQNGQQVGELTELCYSFSNEQQYPNEYCQVSLDLYCTCDYTSQYISASVDATGNWPYAPGMIMHRPASLAVTGTTGFGPYTVGAVSFVQQSTYGPYPTYNVYFQLNNVLGDNFCATPPAPAPSSSYGAPSYGSKN